MDWASDAALGVRRSAFNAVASGFASGPDSNVSTPANAAAAVTALINFNMYANIAGARCPNTLATTGGNGCSTQVTQRLNLVAVDA